jgi:hypothetical protein
MSSIKINNRERDPRSAHTQPTVWKDTYTNNVVKHVKTAKHHLTVYHYLRGHLHGMRHTAKVVDEGDEVSEYEVGDDDEPTRLSTEYERLLVYVRWRERLCMDATDWELEHPEAVALTSEETTPATKKAFRRLGPSAEGRMPSVDEAGQLP